MVIRSHVRNVRKRSTRTYRTIFAFISCATVLLLLIAHRNYSLYTKTFMQSPEVHVESIKRRMKKYRPKKVPGGDIFRIPRSWNRLHSPWLRRPPVKLKNPEQSRHRYLHGPYRIMTSDGIGHSMCAINFELNIALNFNLTYTHRVGYYSSLSYPDRLAVENFFGWGVGELPRETLKKHGCSPKDGQWPYEDDLYSCHTCGKPLPNESMKIANLVQVPHNLTHFTCREPYSVCWYHVQRFLSANWQSHTIFQLPERTCGSHQTDSNLLFTRNFFFHKYWERQGILPWPISRYHSTAQHLRPLKINQKELNIAIHSRRGDFLRLSTKRRLTKDLTFARIVRQVLKVIEDVGGHFSKIPIAIHIYSEGKLMKGHVPSSHAVNFQNKLYYNSRGIPRNERWWYRIITSRSDSNGSSFVPSLAHLKIIFHISEDTLLSLHDMISADVFIGSDSGMSKHLVWSIARGIVLLPRTGATDGRIGNNGYTCCSVPFDNWTGKFSSSRFRWFWEAYEYANAESVAFASKSQK